MSTATIEIYNALVKAGIDKDKAQTVADSIVTREDAKHFATKADIGALKADMANLKSDLQRFVFTTAVTQTVFLVGMTITLIQVLG